jgi:putative nucleotidyltransferase with HDIG domain
MRSLPWKARIYILFLAALTAGAVLFSIATIGKEATWWVVVFGIAVAIALLDAFPIHRFGEQVEMTISNAVKFAGVLLFPVPVAIVGTFVGTLFGELPAKRVWFRKLFNISAMTLTWAVTAWLYYTLNNPPSDYFGSLENVFVLVLAGVTAFVFNSMLVCLVISLAARLPFLYVWTQNSKLAIWQEFSILALGLSMAVLWRYNPVSIVLAALPLLVVRDWYKTANHLRNQTQDALRALVRVIDERDHHTFNHSENVSNYAQAVASAFDLSQDEVEVIASAALLHDLGKIGMADDILYNPKLLNPNERKSAEQHAEIGAMLLSKFPLFDKGAVLVRHHHEHYDGKGYPDGLKGEDIPLGARIISVADAYQAMIEDRSYRRALTQDEAVAQLIKCSGTQFDPRVVHTFVQLLQRNPSKVEPIPMAIPQLVEME